MGVSDAPSRESLFQQERGEAAIPFRVRIAARLDITTRGIESLGAQVERVGFEPGGGETGAGDFGFGEVHQGRARAGARMGGMDVERVHEIIAPVNEADDFACPLGDAEFRPASRDIIAGTIFARIGLRRSGRDGRAPCRLECGVEDGDEGGAVSGTRGADVEGGCHGTDSVGFGRCGQKEDGGYRYAQPTLRLLILRK